MKPQHRFSNHLQGVYTIQEKALPILHAKAKEELFCFIKPLIGHYLLKEKSSPVAGPTIFSFPLLQQHSNWGKNPTAAMNLIQKDLYKRSTPFQIGFHSPA